MHAALGVLLLCLQVVFLVLLIGHVVRVRSADGVSLLGEALWAVAGVGWAVYAVATGSTAVIVSGALAAGGSGALAVVAWGAAPPDERRRVATVTALAAATGAGAFAVFGAAGLAVCLSVFGAVQFTPHLVTAWRLWVRREPVVGLSVPGTAVRSVYAAGWAAYAAGWALWGSAAGPVVWPLLVWGAVGAVAFAAQGTVAYASRRWVPAAAAALDAA